MQFPTETFIVACPICLTAYTQQGVTCPGWGSLHLQLPPNSAFKSAMGINVPVQVLQCGIYEDMAK